jgi:hypothetical protein
VDVVLLIWSSGLASVVQFPVASVIAVTRTWEESSGLPEPAHKYKGVKRNGYKIYEVTPVLDYIIKRYDTVAYGGVEV